jgi:hypothetical protein
MYNLGLADKIVAGKRRKLHQEAENRKKACPSEDQPLAKVSVRLFMFVRTRNKKTIEGIEKKKH